MMNCLTKTQLQHIDLWIHKFARSVDEAKWDYLFNNGSKDKIVLEMLKYQNDDGGFGHGFEADILSPLSGSIPSAEAIFMAYDYELNCQENWFQNLLKYFENTFQNSPSFWENVPRGFEDHPHAPWWVYSPDTKFSPNPCAIIASALILYGTDKQKEMGYTVAKKCLDFLCSDDACGDHDNYNLLRLIDALQRIESPLINQLVIDAMKRRVLDNVSFDRSQWMEYVSQPLDIIDNPQSIWYNLVSIGVEMNFTYWLKQINDNDIWTPNFSWGIDNDISNKVTENWKGYIAVKRARIFKNFGLVEA